MKKNLMALAIGIVMGIALFGAKDVYAATTVEHTEDDYMVMPDKYNTGADESVLERVTADDAAALKERFGIPFKKSGDLLTINFYGKKSLSGIIYVENIDFSANSMAIYKANLCENEFTIVFVNCKFAGFGMNESNELANFEFHNCTFNSISGSNMNLYNCYIGGKQSDGIRAFYNVNIVNCYIADKSLSYVDVNTGNHTDGTQIYGSNGGPCGNIHYTNCRFELPQMKNSTAYVNACIMLQIEFCDANDITFTDCTVNGGGYSIYAWSKKSEYALTNARLSNIAVGCASGWGSVYSRVGKDVVLDNIYDTDSLYVGSVWEENGSTHISVTNDTNTVRTLEVHSNLGTYTYTINACPLHSEVTEGMTFADFPFDIDINVGQVEWIVCYDVTNDQYKQLRYVNYTDAELNFYENEGVSLANSFSANDSFVDAIYDYDYDYDNNNQVDDYYSESINTSVVASGECGSEITWTLDADGVMTLTGYGSTYDYHSGKTAPWSEFLNEIKVLVVSEGITRIGNQTFRDCKALETVVLPSTVETLGKLAFRKCSSLNSITIPAAVSYIGERCFESTGLKSVTYLGEDYQNIEVGGYNNTFSKLLAQ